MLKFSTQTGYQQLQVLASWQQSVPKMWHCTFFLLVTTKHFVWYAVMDCYMLLVMLCVTGLWTVCRKIAWAIQSLQFASQPSVHWWSQIFNFQRYGISLLYVSQNIFLLCCALWIVCDHIWVGWAGFWNNDCVWLGPEYIKRSLVFPQIGHFTVTYWRLSSFWHF